MDLNNYTRDIQTNKKHNQSVFYENRPISMRMELNKARYMTIADKVETRQDINSPFISYNSRVAAAAIITTALSSAVITQFTATIISLFGRAWCGFISCYVGIMKGVARQCISKKCSLNYTIKPISSLSLFFTLS